LPGSLDFICLLSADGQNEFPESGFVQQGQESDEDDPETRCLDNKRGEWELKGLAALGLTFTYNDKGMKTGIDKYTRGELSQTDVASYGLEIKYYAGFQKIVMPNHAALQFFCVSSYISRNLWKNGQSATRP